MNQRHLLNPRIVAGILLAILLVGILAWMRQRDRAFATREVATRPVDATPRPATAPRARPSPPAPESTRTPQPEPTPPEPGLPTPRFEIESAPPGGYRLVSIGGPVTVEIPPFPDGSGVPEAPAELLDAAVRSIEIAGPGNAVTVVDSDHRYWIEFRVPSTQADATLRVQSDYLQLASGRDELIVGLDPAVKVYEIPVAVSPRLPFTPPADAANMKAAWEDYLTEAFGIVVESKLETAY